MTASSCDFESPDTLFEFEISRRYNNVCNCIMPRAICRYAFLISFRPLCWLLVDMADDGVGGACGFCKNRGDRPI